MSAIKSRWKRCMTQLLRYSRYVMKSIPPSLSLLILYVPVFLALVGPMALLLWQAMKRDQDLLDHMLLPDVLMTALDSCLTNSQCCCCYYRCNCCMLLFLSPFIKLLDAIVYSDSCYGIFYILRLNLPFLPLKTPCSDQTQHVTTSLIRPTISGRVLSLFCP